MDLTQQPTLTALPSASSHNWRTDAYSHFMRGIASAPELDDGTAIGERLVRQLALAKSPACAADCIAEALCDLMPASGLNEVDPAVERIREFAAVWATISFRRV